MSSRIGDGERQYYETKMAELDHLENTDPVRFDEAVKLFAGHEQVTVEDVKLVLKTWRERNALLALVEVLRYD